MVIEPLDDFWGELVSFEFPGGVESGFWLGDRVDGNDASGVDEVSDLVVGVEDDGVDDGCVLSWENPKGAVELTGFSVWVAYGVVLRQVGSVSHVQFFARLVVVMTGYFHSGC